MVQKLTTEAENKVLVGLTGIFGSGKSLVADLFKKLGARTISADLLAHEALRAKAPTFEAIKALFPDVPIGSEGLDRRALGRIVFENPEKRKALEEIIHPYVLDRIREESSVSSNSLIVVEVPLLYEAGFEVYFDYIVVVSAEEKLILERLKEKGFSESQVRARWKVQKSLEEKIKKANFVLDNSNTLSETKLEVEKLYTSLIRR